MAIASSLSRNTHRFRIISRQLCSQSSNQWRSVTRTPQLCDSFRGAADTTNAIDHPHFLSSVSVIGQGHGISSLEMYNRHFCTKTTNETVPPPKSESTNGNSESTNGNSESTNESSESKKSEGSDKSGESSQSGEEGRSVRSGPVSWLSFIFLVLTGAGLVFYYDQEKKRHIEEITKSSDAVKPGPSVGQAAIGGPFSLVNHEGKRVTEKDFMGKWTLMYFGFTHCPDICPDELIKLAAAVDKIKENAKFEIVPVFISVDPERDSVEQVGAYVAEFHPKLIGLTGTKEEVRQVAQAYRVYYMKAVDPDASPDEYLVDHSIIMYLMSPSMDFVKYFGKNYNVDELADGIIKEIKQYKKK